MLLQLRGNIYLDSRIIVKQYRCSVYYIYGVYNGMPILYLKNKILILKIILFYKINNVSN